MIRTVLLYRTFALRCFMFFSMLLSANSMGNSDGLETQDYIPLSHSEFFLQNWQLRQGFVVAVLMRHKENSSDAMDLEATEKTLWLSRYSAQLIEEEFWQALSQQCRFHECDMRALADFLATDFDQTHWSESQAGRWVGGSVGIFIDDLMTQRRFSLERYVGKEYDLLIDKYRHFDIYSTLDSPYEFSSIYQTAEPELKKLTACSRHGIGLVPQMDVAAEVSNRLKPLLRDEALKRKFPDLMASISTVVNGHYVEITQNGHRAYHLLQQLKSQDHNQFFMNLFSGDERYSMERIAGYSTDELRSEFKAMQVRRAEFWKQE